MSRAPRSAMRRVQLASALAAALGLRPRVQAAALGLRPTAQAAHGPAGGAATAVPPRLALARELLASLEPSRTGYRHRSQVRFADGARPSLAWTDCSGLLNALLGRTDPRVLAALVAASPDGRPQAIDYVAAIERGDGFLSIARIDTIVPGDIVAIAYPAGAPDTGHVALVDARPAPVDGAPAHPGWMQWALPVIDATASPHGPDDERAGPPPRTGAGRGVMRLYADAAGRPAGHAWSRAPHSVLHPAVLRPIALGRPL
jgi:hypothetical protein